MLALLLGLAAVVAPPPADDMTGFYGNTLIAIDGRIESHFYYRPDHTFKGVVPLYHFDLQGRWSEKKNGVVCRVFDPPIPKVHNPDCGPMLVHAVGDKKTFKDGDSQKLVKGIQ